MNTMRAFHGTWLLSEKIDGTWHRGLAGVLQQVKAGTFVRGPGDMGLFYVAPSAELAARYANAQATRSVDANATVLGRNAAVVEFECLAPVRWSTRDVSHGSLDLAEATVKANEVRCVRVRACVDAYVAADLARCPSLIAAMDLARELGIEFVLEVA